MKTVKTTRNTILLLAATALLSLGATAGASAQVGNVDIRALEPPIDVTPQQLQAQELPRGAPPFQLFVPARRY